MQSRLVPLRLKWHLDELHLPSTSRVMVNQSVSCRKRWNFFFLACPYNIKCASAYVWHIFGRFHCRQQGRQLCKLAPIEDIEGDAAWFVVESYNRRLHLYPNPDIPISEGSPWSGVFRRLRHFHSVHLVSAPGGSSSWGFRGTGITVVRFEILSPTFSFVCHLVMSQEAWHCSGSCSSTSDG